MSETDDAVKADAERTAKAESDKAGRNKEYVAAMLDWAAADVAQVYLRVTAAVGLVLVYVTQIPMDNLQALNEWETVALFAGLGFVTAAAILYFFYVHRTHNERKAVARCYVQDTPADPAKLLFREFRKWRVTVFGVGNTAFLVGAGLLAIVLWTIVTS